MKIQQELFHRTQTAKDFLFYKTDEKTPEDTTQPLSQISNTSILEKFPDMLSGKAFLDHVKTVLEEKNHFGVMAMGLDEKAKIPDKPATEDIMAVLECLDAFCSSEKGFWGKLDSDLFICVFPEKDAESIQTAGENVQKQLAGKTDQTITIGMAAYPVLDYGKEALIECALKALNHAAFFGSDSRAFFDAVSLNISGDQFYQKGNIEGAISEYKLALKLDSKDVNVLNSMGVCYAVMGDFDTALSFFESAGQYDPDEVMAWYNSALVHKLKGDKAKALEYFIKAGTKKKDSFEIAFQTGKIYFETGDTENGRQYYQKALDLAEEAHGNQRFVGDCHAALDEMDKAKKAYQAAVKENPNDAYALSALGMLYDLKGESPEIAMVFSQQSVDISPQNSLFRRRLALLHLKQKSWAEALEGFKLADQLDIDAENAKNAATAKEKTTPAKKPAKNKNAKSVKSVA